MNKNVDQSKNWEVVELNGKSVNPRSIKRLSDGVVFSLEDYVTNGTKMKGHIKAFHYCFGTDEVFVEHDWSGIQMNLDSLSHVNKLPSKYQIGNKVILDFGKSGKLIGGRIIKVHFTESKVLYDVDLVIESPDGKTGGYTRIYNIESDFVKSAA